MDFHKDIDPRFPLSADAPANWEKHLRELMKSQDDLILVALDSDTTVGYATAALVATAPLWERRTYGQISDMAVTSAYRRRGLGEQMFGYIMEWFASKDIRRVELLLLHAT